MAKNNWLSHFVLCQLVWLHPLAKASEVEVSVRRHQFSRAEQRSYQSLRIGGAHGEANYGVWGFVEAIKGRRDAVYQELAGWHGLSTNDFLMAGFGFGTNYRYHANRMATVTLNHRWPNIGGTFQIGYTEEGYRASEHITYSHYRVGWLQSVSAHSELRGQIAALEAEATHSSFRKKGVSTTLAWIRAREQTAWEIAGLYSCLGRTRDCRGGLRDQYSELSGSMTHALTPSWKAKLSLFAIEQTAEQNLPLPIAFSPDGSHSSTKERIELHSLLLSVGAIFVF